MSELRTRRIAVVSTALAAMLLVALVVVAFVPRTVAEGGTDDTAWELRVAPGLLAPSISLRTAEGVTPVPDSGRGAHLADTVALATPPAADASTLVVGPTPGAATSIRVTSVDRGVGEAITSRVLWRRFHLAVVPGETDISQLVAIDSRGRIVEVVDDVTHIAAGVRPGEP